MARQEAENLAFIKNFEPQPMWKNFEPQPTLEWDPVYELVHRRAGLPVKIIDKEGDSIPSYSPEVLTELGDHMAFFSEDIVESAINRIVENALNQIKKHKSINSEAVFRKVERDIVDLKRFNTRAVAFFQSCHGLQKDVLVRLVPNNEISITLSSPTRKKDSETHKDADESTGGTDNVLTPDFRLRRTNAANQI